MTSLASRADYEARLQALRKRARRALLYPSAALALGVLWIMIPILMARHEMHQLDHLPRWIDRFWIAPVLVLMVASQLLWVEGINRAVRECGLFCQYCRRAMTPPDDGKTLLITGACPACGERAIAA